VVVGPELEGEVGRVALEEAGGDGPGHRVDQDLQGAPGQLEVGGIRLEGRPRHPEHDVVQVGALDGHGVVRRAQVAQVRQRVLGDRDLGQVVGEALEALPVHVPEELVLGADEAVDGGGRRPHGGGDPSGGDRADALVGQQLRRRLDQADAQGVVVRLRSSHP
jgi:hypothetical protein